MSDRHPPATLLNGGNGGGAQVAVNSPKTFGPKRQRRPSVRLGDLGGADGLYDYPRRTVNGNSKQWKANQSMSSEIKKESNRGSKTRTLTNLSTSDENNTNKEDTVAIGSWRVNNSNKDSKKRVTCNANSSKRVRSNWVPKIDDNGNGNNLDGDEKSSGGGDDDLDVDGYGGEFDVDNSDREQRPSHSLENSGDGNERSERDVYYNRRSGIRIQERDSLHGDGVESSGPSDTGDREYMNNGRCSGDGGEDGVKIWLNSIGLGRYASIFEIHEVDDEVLPMLTLEDLKDMGINAVGSRRKLFCAIQKLGKGFS